MSCPSRRALSRALLVALLAPAGVLAQPLPRAQLAPDLEPADGVVRVALTAAETGDPIYPYAYNELTPGPLIRMRAGEVLEAELENRLPTPTTIHWHGVEVPYEMDGTTWQFAPTGSGERFTYRFAVERPGTYWYHPHFDTARQVDGGLFGALIVEDPEAPPVDDELMLVFDQAMEGHDSPQTAHGHARVFPVWRINGAVAPLSWTARGGSVVRVRALNASSTGYLDLEWPGMRQLAGDQSWLSAVHTPERVLLGPGDRAEFEWLVGEAGFAVRTHPYSLNGGSTWQAPLDLLTVEVDGPAPPPESPPWPFTGAPQPDDPGGADIVYVLSGSDRTGFWVMNGERFPDITVEEVPQGSRPIIEVRNLSPTEHPFHIHGNRFEVLSLDGEPPPVPMVEDTLNVPVHGRIRLRLIADNPGEWMTHCHILPHAEEGMMTVLRVAQPEAD